MAFDVDAWLDGYKPAERTVTLYARGDLADEHAHAQQELAEAGLSGQSDDDGTLERAQALAERITEIEAEMEASKRTFLFRSMGWETWYRLVAEHPATDAERAEGHKEEVSRGFWHHAIAAASVEPKLTTAQAERMQELSPVDYDQLRAAVQSVHEEVVTAPKSPMAGAVRQLLDASSTNRSQRRSRGRSGGAANGAQSRSTTTTKKGASSAAKPPTTRSGPKKTGG